MVLSLQSFTGVLSALVRLSAGAQTASTPIYPITRPMRSLLLLKSPHFSTCRAEKSKDVFEKDSSRTEVNPADGDSQYHKSPPPRAPFSVATEDIKAKTLPRTLPRLPTSLPAHNLQSLVSGHKAPGSRGEDTQPSGPSVARHTRVGQPREHWQTQKEALQKKFGEQGWRPRKKLSPDTMEGIRALHEQFPEKYTTPVLAEQFKVSPEAIRRILKSKWRPSPEKMQERRARWAKRHDRIWDAQAEMGLRPQRKKDRKPEGPEKLDEIIPLVQNFDAGKDLPRP